eukprot:PLAT5728.1.p1 GENE.PLAT5728.1~~PLAT5728.1.p1  ORF type:complete len:131 (+),score=43.86 PLAT5728.1:2-394(+)
MILHGAWTRFVVSPLFIDYANQRTLHSAALERSLDGAPLSAAEQAEMQYVKDLLELVAIKNEKEAEKPKKVRRMSFTNRVKNAIKPLAAVKAEAAAAGEGGAASSRRWALEDVDELPTVEAAGDIEAGKS